MMAEADPLKPDPADQPDVTEEDDADRVRAAIGEGLRRFYESVVAEPIPPEWIDLVGGSPELKR